MNLGRFEDVEADWGRFAALGRPPVIALVGCGASKGTEPAPARELYTGDLFKKSYAYALKRADRVLILSGRWGLVDPEYVLEPYEYKLHASDANLWSHTVVNCYLGLDSRFSSGWAPRSSKEDPRLGLEIPGTLLLLAGREYADPLVERLRHIPRITVDQPLAGMQIGERLAFLKKALEEAA